MTEHRCFEIFILLAILVNTIVLACHHFMISDEEVDVQVAFNSSFVGLFTIEAVIKIIA